jgi:hypothetical protein
LGHQVVCCQEPCNTREGLAILADEYSTQVVADTVAPVWLKAELALLGTATQAVTDSKHLRYESAGK